jgi:hypothetical protein
MIEQDRDDDIFEIDCDYCGAAHESIDADPGWQAMIDKLKQLGWHIKKIGSDWHHMCPDCFMEHRPW